MTIVLRIKEARASRSCPQDDFRSRWFQSFVNRDCRVCAFSWETVSTISGQRVGATLFLSATLCVLCVSVVCFAASFSPKRHRLHRGCTEKKLARTPELRTHPLPRGGTDCFPRKTLGQDAAKLRLSKSGEFTRIFDFRGMRSRQRSERTPFAPVQ